MNILKRLANLFSPSARNDEHAEWIYVRCGRCGEAISTRVDLHNDLSIRYTPALEKGVEEVETTYFCRKTLVGQQRCFQRIEVELTFDRNRQLLERQIDGGEFISEEDYYQLRSPSHV